MALDSLIRITHSGSEKEAIESILQLFNLLFYQENCYMCLLQIDNQLKYILYQNWRKMNQK